METQPFDGQVLLINQYDPVRPESRVDTKNSECCPLKQKKSLQKHEHMSLNIYNIHE